MPQIAMLTYYTFGVIEMVVHLQPARSPVHLTLSGLRQWQLFYRILKLAALSSGQTLLTSVALIAITAFVARFGVEALAGYGLVSRLELLIYSLVLALGVGTTTMVGICVGAGLVDRARRETLVSCVLEAAIFGTVGLGVAASGRWIVEQFTDAEQVVVAASGYPHVAGMGEGNGSAVDQPAEGCRRAAGRLGLQWPDPELTSLYYLVAVSIMLSASTLAAVFAF